MNQNTVIVDTNVIIRFLVGDGGSFAADAAEFFVNVENGDTVAVVKDMILAESAYVLEKVYEVPKKEIASALQKLLILKNIRMDDKHVAMTALEIFAEENVDFADAYVVACGRVSGLTVKSYDKGVNRLLCHK